jgi:putative Mg2+ transporter-C (MgtC) family protein
MSETSMTAEAILLRLVLAGVIGGVLGYERSQHGPTRSIGIAGMMLVAIGSSTFMMLALHEAATDRSAIGRAIQSMLQGIGFLAGAVIFKGGTDVRGIKTAATVWITSAIGLATGTGFWWLGVIVGVATALILFLTDLFPGMGREQEGAEDTAERGMGKVDTPSGR